MFSFVLRHIYPEKITHVSPLDRGLGGREGQITALAGNETTTVNHVTLLTLSMHVSRLEHDCTDLISP